MAKILVVFIAFVLIGLVGWFFFTLAAGLIAHGSPVYASGCIVVGLAIVACDVVMLGRLDV